MSLPTARPDQAARLRRLVDKTSGRDGRDGSRQPASRRPPVVLAPSTASGSVSFRPSPVRALPPAAAGAAASGVGSVSASAATGDAPSPRLARAIAVTSGKGGVGKSNLAVNLAVAMGVAGRRVCLLDADLGLANADVLCNITPKLTLHHVVTGRCRLEDVIRVGPGGFRLIPGASGVGGMADFGRRQRAIVLEQLAAIDRAADVIIIDCAAGVSSNVLAFAAAAQNTLVVTTPEPTALTDAYGMIKCLVRRSPRARVHLVVNMVTGPEEARSIHKRMNRVTQSFLGRSIGFAGAVPFDPAVPAAVRQRLPFTLFAPDGSATEAVRAIGRRITGTREPAPDSGTRGGFFSRLVAWLERRDDSISTGGRRR